MDANKSIVAKTIVIALLVFTGVVTYVKIWDQDTWWHLMAGQVIASSSSLPREDSFSHTRNGEKWINDEWLGDFSLFNTFKKYGVSGLQALVCGFSMLIAFILLQTALRLGADTIIAAPLIAFAVLGARIRLTTRPELSSILFICSVFFILTRILSSGNITQGKASDNRDHRRTFVLMVMIPLLQAFWVNFHPGAPFALFLIFCAIAASAAAFIIRTGADFRLEPVTAAGTMRGLGFVFIVTVGATLLNPYGLHGITAPLEFARNSSYLKYIAEWAPVPWKEFLSLNGPPGHLALPFFLATGVMGFLYAYRNRKLNIFNLLIFVATAYMAFTSRRFIGTFALLAAPITAAYITPVIFEIFKTGRARKILAATAILFMAIAGYAYGPESQRFQWGKGVNEKYFPGHTIEFIRNNSFSGNMYNTYGLGGPLIWGLYPDHKVYVDGRVPLYGNDFYMDLMNFEMSPSVKRWNEMQDEFGFTFAVLKRDRQAVAVAIAGGKGGWRIIYWDSYNIVFARSIPEHESLIRENAYKMIDPYNALSTARQWDKLSADEKIMMVRELKRNTEQNPRSIQPILALAFIAFIEKDYKRSEKLALHGLDIDPGQARLHGLLAEIYLLRDKKKLALAELRKAAKILPDYKSRIREIRGQ